MRIKVSLVPKNTSVNTEATIVDMAHKTKMRAYENKGALPTLEDVLFKSAGEEDIKSLEEYLYNETDE
jgi:hypothetical protein